MSEPITIIVCTFRRPHVTETLASILRHEGRILGQQLQFVVVDNDETPSAEAMVRELFAASGVTSYTYVHAPARNISVARNAGLDHCSTRWAVLMDDDELATNAMIFHLRSASKGRQAVFGRTLASYHRDAPAWLVNADLHSNEIAQPDGRIDRGYTSLVLLDVEWVRRHGIRFDDQLGQVGGEDVLFFHQMYRAGASLAYAPHAVALEPVPASRWSLDWYLRRRWRSGQVKAHVKRRYSSGVATAAFCARSAAVTSLSLAIGAIVAPFSRGASAKWIGRGVENLGALAHTAGAPLYREYA